MKLTFTNKPKEKKTTQKQHKNNYTKLIYKRRDFQNSIVRSKEFRWTSMEFLLTVAVDILIMILDIVMLVASILENRKDRPTVS